MSTSIERPLHVVFGCNGPLGVKLMELLVAAGKAVVGVCRSGRSETPPGAVVISGDATDAAAVRAASRGAEAIYSCVGIDYRLWSTTWPRLTDALLAGAASSGAGLVFADNLYAYGPHQGTLTEDLPLTEYGKKPVIRATMRRAFLEAHERGDARVALVAGSDFYGPGVRSAMLGETFFGPLVAGKAAQFIGNPDLPHTYTYIDDFARALVTVATDEDAFGQVWHVPNAPTRTTREIHAEAVQLAGVRDRGIRTIPRLLFSILAAFHPLLREIKELLYQWEKPYVVSSEKFEQRFGAKVTGWTEGLRATIEWYRANG